VSLVLCNGDWDQALTSLACGSGATPDPTLQDVRQASGLHIRKCGGADTLRIKGEDPVGGNGVFTWQLVCMLAPIEGNCR